MSDLTKKKLSISTNGNNLKSDSEGQIRQSFSHGRSRVVAVEVKKKRAFVNKNVRVNGPRNELDKATSSLVRKTGLTSIELDNRIKAVQELAGIHVAEAKRRAESAKESISSRITENEKAVSEKQISNKVVHKQDNVRRSKIENANKEDKKAGSSNGALQKKSKFVAEKQRSMTVKQKSDQPYVRGSGTKSTYEKNSFSHNRSVLSVSRIGRDDGTVFEQSFNCSQDKRSTQRSEKNHSRDDRYFGDDESRQQKYGMQIKRDKDELLNRSMSKTKISIYNALDDENDSLVASTRRVKSKAKKISNVEESQKIVREVLIPDTITVQELANRMAIRVSDLIKSLMKVGIMATINQVIDADTAELVVLELGHKPKRVGDEDIVSDLISKTVDDERELVPRPPIVTVMGHVDHGKTSLLDAIRRTDVALNEAGGITQHIGAYQITTKSMRRITFIDTPGHAAFTEMRARGANITDVVVLVVAADDGVKEQTIEALNHAKAANVQIIVAINKIDKPGADPNKVRNDLLSHGIFVESLGGDVIDVEVSAKTGYNLDLLEESILLQADVLELKANPARMAEAVVLEAKIEKGLGPVATILVKNGTLHVGDIFVSGTVNGKVRAIRNDLKQNLSDLLPGSPGEIIGFNTAPIPGDDFIVVSDDAKAKEIADIRQRKKKEKEWLIKRNSSSDVLSVLSSYGNVKKLDLIIKADTHGSIEAIADSLGKLSNDEVVVNVLHSGVGGITENDVILANASNAMIVGFNVRANALAKDQGIRDGVNIKYYSIIYDLIDDVTSILSGMLSPTLSEKVIGSAEVRQIFEISKVGKIAGCMVVDGVIKRTAKVRILRDNVVIHTGDVKSIQRKKDSVKEVKEGFECGISLESYNDIHVKDVLEFFEIEEIARTLDV